MEDSVHPSDLFNRHLDTVYQHCGHLQMVQKDLRTGRTGPASVVQECGVAVRKRITDHLAVYTAALMAILALRRVEEVKPDSSYVL